MHAFRISNLAASAIVLVTTTVHLQAVAPFDHPASSPFQPFGGLRSQRRIRAGTQAALHQGAFMLM